MANPDDAIDGIRRFVELARTIGADVARTVTTHRPQIEALFTSLGEAIRSFEAGHQQRLTLYPQLFAQVAPLAQRGWFISGYFGLSEMMELAGICSTVTPDALDRRVADMYRASLAEHVESLSRDYATRSFAIQPAINAHGRCEYALSVPIFFAQAEGIFFDRAREYIFRKEHGRNIRDEAQKQLAALAQEIEPYDGFSRFMEIMWRPFVDALPIAYSENDRSKHGYHGLNRHTVLHGIALAEYATEENSLKAFSLLSHVGALVSEREDRKT
jgi:hypothetical protein